MDTENQEEPETWEEAEKRIAAEIRQAEATAKALGYLRLNLAEPVTHPVVCPRCFCLVNLRYVQQHSEVCRLGLRSE